jgi:hypothetical protein
MIGALAMALLLLVWAILSMTGGVLLALLARRLHPALSLRRLWIFYSVLLGITVAGVLAIAWR